MNIIPRSSRINLQHLDGMQLLSMDILLLKLLQLFKMQGNKDKSRLPLFAKLSKARILVKISKTN
jgi:hypothetical protein